MHIGFVNYTPILYTVQTPRAQPLGGSESALLYLAIELAKRGHEVTVFGRTHADKKIDGVWHKGNAMYSNDLKDLDVLVLQNTPVEGKWLRKIMNPKTKLVFWTQHAHDQEAIKPLCEQETVDAFDAFVCISFWQLEQYLSRFPMKRKQCTILRNAIAPSFENLFANPPDIMRTKTQPILAYTSVPFRGLEHMLEIWPRIITRIPDAQFRIFSSMQVYQMDVQQEKREYQSMYDTLSKLPGVKYIGSLPQEELALQMRDVAILAYPNTFAETACISAMEAMAAGAHVISTQLGALPETTAGFADLVPLTPNKEDYIASFVEYVCEYWSRLQRNRDAVQTQLGNQVFVVNQCYAWELRAKEWEQWLAALLS